MSDRGDYRSWYAAIVDDPDFQALTPLAFKTLFVLKMTLGAAGIGIARRLVLCEQIGCSTEELEAALVELETPKPDGARGWIARERNIVWIVNGLKFEPTLSPENVKKHRPYVRRLLAPLGDRPIVREFVAYYASWFDSCPMPENGDRVSDTSAYPTDRVSKGNRYTATSDSDSDENQQQQQRTSDSDGSAAAAPARTLARWLDKFYGEAKEKRVAAIREQLGTLWNGGSVKLRGHPVSAKDRAHLERKAAEMLEPEFSIRDDDRAIVILLQKLHEPERDAQGRLPSEAAADADRAEQRDLDAYDAERKRTAREYREAHPADVSTLEETVQPDVKADERNQLAYRAELTARTNEAILGALHFPDFEQWRAQRRAS